MVARTGHVKVIDFGLAKRLMSAEQSATEQQTLTQLTEMGTTVGTLAYMSPDHPEYGKDRIAMELEIKFGMHHAAFPALNGLYHDYRLAA